MVKRLSIVLVLLVAGFASVGLIPSDPELKPAAVSMTLPEEMFGWPSEAVAPTEEEILSLAKDTEFEKRNYSRFRPYTDLEHLQTIHVGIVLSGHDLNNSIHRPERCMPAQGFKDLQISSFDLPLEDRTVTIRRIVSYRPVVGRDGEPIHLRNVTYYWFVGHDTMTGSHWARTLIDIRDRLLKGYNQRWAYFTVASYVTDNLTSIGGRSEEETDQVLQQFVREVIKRNVLPDVMGAG